MIDYSNSGLDAYGDYGGDWGEADIETADNSNSDWWNNLINSQVGKDIASNLINIGSKKAGVTPVYPNMPSGVPTYSQAGAGGILNNPIVLIGGAVLIAVILMNRGK